MRYLASVAVSLLLATVMVTPPFAVAGQQPASPSPVLTPERRETAGRIIGAALVDDTGWNRLAYIGDRIGHRLSGSAALEKAIVWAADEMRRDGLDNVRTEKVMVPHWVRGAESATLLEPVERDLSMLGLGNSVGTGPEGVTADVVVVSNYDELERLGEAVRGKIVCYNVPYTDYGATVQYRGSGASRAAKHGAVAVLVRSVGPVSLDTPHTGALRYDEAVAKIPAAAITIEGAETLGRMQSRGERLRLRLVMNAKMLPDVESANVVAELKGSQYPDQIILLAAHYDSWDTGTGSHDDAGGCIQIWEAIRLLKKLGLRPKRTIRVVLYTNEENGLRGGVEYLATHRAELANHLLAVETDSGTFKPEGLALTTTNEGLRALMADIMSLLEPIGAGKLAANGGGADIGPLMREGVPGGNLDVDSSTYFHYHHTHADTLDKIKPIDLKLCIAALAVMAYMAADVEVWPSTGKPA